MFKKEIEEIYELCKKVMEERPESYCVFDLSPIAAHVFFYKDEEKFEKNHGTHADLNHTIFYNNPALEYSNRKTYKEIKETLLGFLEGK